MGLSATQVNILVFAFCVLLWFTSPPYNGFELLILATMLAIASNPREFKRWLMEKKDDRTQNYGWYSWKRKIFLY